MSQPPFAVTVCLCTHNPRPEYFPRVLAALAAQRLDPDHWELLIIDNRSQPPVALGEGLPAPRHTRIVAEPELGLTCARLRAIAEASGELIVFVDDDNVLAPDYLEEALRVMRERPSLGAIGGRCRGEFEEKPPVWSRPYLAYLAVAERAESPKWNLHPNAYEPWYPCGAGLVIRRALARAYARELEKHPERRQLDRRGDSLTSAGDIDMLLTCMDQGTSIGTFPQLALVHLIPRERVRFDYLRRMIYHANYSLYHLMLLRQSRFRPRRWPLAYLTCVGQGLLQGAWHPRALLLAVEAARGRYAACRDFRKLKGTAKAGEGTPGEDFHCKGVRRKGKIIP